MDGGQTAGRRQVGRARYGRPGPTGGFWRRHRRAPLRDEQLGQLNRAFPVGLWLPRSSTIAVGVGKNGVQRNRSSSICSGDPEALWTWLARIALEGCGVRNGIVAPLAIEF
jgi:hypothetical protein